MLCNTCESFFFKSQRKNTGTAAGFTPADVTLVLFCRLPHHTTCLARENRQHNTLQLVAYAYAYVEIDSDANCCMTHTRCDCRSQCQVAPMRFEASRQMSHDATIYLSHAEMYLSVSERISRRETCLLHFDCSTKRLLETSLIFGCEIVLRVINVVELRHEQV